MIRPSVRSGPSRPEISGFSLVEMMVASVLGLLMVGAVAAVFLGSRATFRTQEGLGQVQESGRYLNYVFYPYVRLAGFLPDPLAQLDPADHFRGPWRPVFGLEEIDAADDLVDAQITGIANPQAGTDVLLITFAGTTDISQSPPETSRNCLGDRIGEHQIAANVFFIRGRNEGADPDHQGEDDISSLMCGRAIIAPGSGSELVTPAIGNIEIDDVQPIIYGVQDMQILYGVDTDQSDDSPLPPALPGYVPNTYFAADQIPDVDGDGTPDWQRVVSVRIELTTVGDESTEGAQVGTETAGDVADDFVDDAHRVQRVFSTTINIRNRLRS